MESIQVRPNIVLADFQRNDVAALVEYLNDDTLYENTLKIPSPYLEADANAYLDSLDQQREQCGHPLAWSIRLMEGEPAGKLVGAVGFHDFVEGHKAEIGYWLGKPFRGRGIMSDVVATIVPRAVSLWGLVRIVGHTNVSNEASAHVLLKNGFHFEGLMRSHAKKNGEFLDSNQYAYLA